MQFSKSTVRMPAGPDQGHLSPARAAVPYDWRAAEKELNKHPQFRTRIDGVDIHFVEVRGEAAERRPLLLLHGWPGSHFEFWKVADRLAHPSQYGGSAADAFDLIIPSLPGYGFSGRVSRPVGPRTSAGLLNRLMVEGLGHAEYMVHGGDQGAIIASFLGAFHGEHCRAMHVNLIGWRPVLDDDGAVGEEEHAIMQGQLLAELPDMAYAIQHWTKPQTLAMGLVDSPVGTAAWMIDKFHDWSDLRHSTFDEVHDRDALLTSVMIYIINGTIGSSLWSYPALLDERVSLADRPFCATPTALAHFPVEVVGFTHRALGSSGSTTSSGGRRSTEAATSRPSSDRSNS
ncbi:epoxide hydrolase family protein [Nocardioides jensenii]|uniref:epoxide hydrolase family protein n=1 Tax=Nocardioides jensenii TaxID=1843 RepID=UPI001C3F2AB0|nr:epoxide hydrolase [Nocardioides jensenii]